MGLEEIYQPNARRLALFMAFATVSVTGLNDLLDVSKQTDRVIENSRKYVI